MHSRWLAFTLTVFFFLFFITFYQRKNAIFVNTRLVYLFLILTNNTNSRCLSLIFLLFALLPKVTYRLHLPQYINQWPCTRLRPWYASWLLQYPCCFQLLKPLTILEDILQHVSTRMEPVRPSPLTCVSPTACCPDPTTYTWGITPAKRRLAKRRTVAWQKKKRRTNF